MFFTLYKESLLLLLFIIIITKLPESGVVCGNITVWWGYKYMFPLDGGSKIHSS